MDTDHPDTVKLLNYLKELGVEGDLEAHIANCASCRGRLQELRQEEEQVTYFRPPERAIEELIARGETASHRASWVRRLAYASCAAVAVTVAVVLALHTAPGPSNEDNGMRFKGALAVIVYLNRQGTTSVADANTRYRAGDRIRLAVVSPLGGYVSLFVGEQGQLQSIDALRNLSVVVGQSLLLPGSLRLDCVGGKERILVCLTGHLLPGGGPPPWWAPTMVLDLSCE